MLAEAEIRSALEAGARFKTAITHVAYEPIEDIVIMETPWGTLRVGRQAIPYFRNVPPETMADIYASQTGVHIDKVDLDVSSSGLLSHVFKDLEDELSDSR